MPCAVDASGLHAHATPYTSLPWSLIKLGRKATQHKLTAHTGVGPEDFTMAHLKRWSVKLSLASGVGTQPCIWIGTCPDLLLPRKLTAPKCLSTAT